ncbi:hypothetical protein HYN48_13270 [Flavobacterium magnum]|uniref:DUF3024 domain-containing protein n=1 Tax=Flavobacterium magnum TaxID=2162713 RepID=A0A2S0RI82_9FLAO|nr:DUF3024 domain-containing protein [Flavobacterium magnum]AWA30970.1 hypothetical protein HYN48_13270 [Flavobacterium magnum]
MIASLEIEELDNYLSYIRPSEELRSKIDIAYRIEKQSVIIFEVTPHWKDPKQKIESNVAKATFVKKDNHWKVFWRRADLKWHSYKPMPIVENLLDFIRLIEKDEYNCFWG